MLYKLHSLDCLRKNNLPTLDYLILNRQNYREQIETFLKENKISRFMVRTDGKGKFSPSVNNEQLSEETLKKIEQFFCDGYTVFVMHSGNIYKNFHSLNITKTGDKIVIEIVGPGFIATDLNRYGFIHEEYNYSIKGNQITKHNIKSNKNVYSKNRQKKIDEVGETQIKENEGYLLKYEDYLPLNETELSYVRHNITNLFQVSKDLQKHFAGNDFVASMSFVDLGDGKDEPIFWDLYNIK